MSRSLQEQLVQAGLADAGRAERRGNSKRRGSGRGQKRAGKQGADRGKTPAGSGRTAGPAAGTAAPGQGTSPRTAPSGAEQTGRLRQMIRTHRIDRAYAAVPYRFTQGARVREVAVTGTQQGRLARGELALVSDGERLELVPAKVARQIRAIDPQAVLVLNGGDGDSNDPDDPYTDYRVPDDLMW